MKKEKLLSRREISAIVLSILLSWPATVLARLTFGLTFPLVCTILPPIMAALAGRRALFYGGLSNLAFWITMNICSICDPYGILSDKPQSGIVQNVSIGILMVLWGIAVSLPVCLHQWYYGE